MITDIIKAKSLCAVVISPPIQDFYFTPHRFCSAGTKIVADLLQKKGLQVTEFSFPSMAKNGFTISVPRELTYLKPFIIENEVSKTSFFRSYKQFGPTLEQCTDMVCSKKADLCFISCFAFCYASTALQLAQKIKRESPKTVIIFGGAGVSTYPAYFLRNDYVDYTLSGEAEISVCNLIDYITSIHVRPDEVSGLGWKQNGNCYFSSISTKTRSEEILCPAIKTKDSKRSVTFSVSLSRGCPLNCSFCSNWICHGKEFRRCSIDQIDSIITQIKAANIPNEKIIRLNFEDDNLLFDYQFWINTIKSLKLQFKNISFFAENGIDYRLLNNDKCKELINFGFSQFNLSLGSVSSIINETADRSLNLQHYCSVIKTISDFNIPVITYFICGFKDDTVESVVRNLAFLSKEKTLIGISLFYPVPGISGYEDKSIFDKVSPVLCCGSSAFPWNNSLSTKTLITAFRLARTINLSKAQTINSMDKQLLDKIYSTKKLFTLLKTGNEIKIIEITDQDYELVRLFFQNFNP